MAIALSLTLSGGLCIAQDQDESLEPAPNAHGQIMYGQPRKESHGSLFGTNGLFNRPASEQPSSSVQPYSKQTTKTSVQSYSSQETSAQAEPTPKATAHHRHSKKAKVAATEEAVQPAPPVKHNLLVPVDRDNGHGAPVSVYKKYHYTD